MTELQLMKEKSKRNRKRTEHYETTSFERAVLKTIFNYGGERLYICRACGAKYKSIDGLSTCPFCHRDVKEGLL